MKTVSLLATLSFAVLALCACPDDAKKAAKREMDHTTQKQEDAKSAPGKFYKKQEKRINKLGQDAVDRANALEKQMDE